MTTSASPVAIHIDFYGALREYGAGIELMVESGSSPEKIKQQLGLVLAEEARQLVSHSVLADNDEILSRNWRLTEPVSLALLPPVSGG